MRKLRIKWNLPVIAADLAAHLESLERSGKLLDRFGQSEDYLKPYALSREDEKTVTILAWGAQCVDCGDTRDYYVVYDHVWKEARLEPNQYCCRKCLAARLGPSTGSKRFHTVPSELWERKKRMNDTERIAKLETAVEQLQAALEAERTERGALPRLVLPELVQNRRNIEMLEENFGLTMKAMDSRFAELARPASGDDEQKWQSLFEIAQAQQGCIRDLYQSVQTLYRQDLLGFEVMGKLSDALDRACGLSELTVREMTAIGNAVELGNRNGAGR